MTIVLLHAGELAEPRSLQECLREIHESDREATVAEINRRKTNGADHEEPSGALKDPGPYVADPRLDGVAVRIRVLSARRADTLDATHQRALARYLKAQDDPETDPIDLAETKGAIFDARRTYVAETVAGLDGVDGVEIVNGGSLSESTLDALERASLINSLYIVASHAQRLDAKKAARFGLSPASISVASTAASVQSIATAPAAVMAAVSTSTASPRSSQEPSTQQTPAPGGT